MSARSKVEKVVVFGGGSFGTAMGVALARQKEDMKVSHPCDTVLVCLQRQCSRVVLLGHGSGAAGIHHSLWHSMPVWGAARV